MRSPRLRLALAGILWLIASLIPVVAHAKGEAYYWKDFNTVTGLKGLYGEFPRIFPKSHQDKDNIYYRLEIPCTVNGIQYGRTITIKQRLFATRSYPTGASVEQNTANNQCKLDLDQNISIHETAAKAGITYPDTDKDGQTDDVDNDDDNDGAPDSIDRDDDGDGIDDVDESRSGPSTTSPTSSSSSSDKCDAGPGFTFIICGGIHTLTRAINGIEQHVIANFLDVKPLGQRITLNINGTTKETDDPRYVLWKAFRALTNGFFVLVFLLIIFANITSINIDAYTIKKMLPKLVVASILVQFSWILSSLAVDASNVLGKGVFLFINDNLSRVDGAYQFSSFQSGISLGLGTVLAGITASAVLFSVLSSGLLLFLLGAFIGLLTLLVTLFIRQILITGMVVLSPLAFVAFVLPNTEGIYRYWSRNFIKLLLMYPIVMLLLASGKVFSVIAAATGGPVAPLFALIALVIPLFIIPTTFKLAGSALSLSSGALGRLTNGRIKGSQFIRDMKTGQRERNVLRANKEGNGLGARLSRGMGKLGTNTLIPTQAGQRRLQSEYAQALRNRGEQYESQFQNNGWSNNRAHMEAIASARSGDSVDINGKKFKVDDAAKAKAIELLARNGEFEVLARVKPVVSDRIWQAGVQRNIGDLLTKAPDLVSGDSAFNNLSAAKIANLHHTTAERLVTYLNSSAGAAARPVVMRAIQQVADTPGLRASIDQRVVGVLTANRSTFSGVSVTHGGTTMSGEDFLNLRAAPNLQSGPDGHRATFSP